MPDDGPSPVSELAIAVAHYTRLLTGHNRVSGALGYPGVQVVANLVTAIVQRTS